MNKREQIEFRILADSYERVETEQKRILKAFPLAYASEIKVGQKDEKYRGYVTAVVVGEEAMSDE